MIANLRLRARGIATADHLGQPALEVQTVFRKQLTTEHPNPRSDSPASSVPKVTFGFNRF
jgi:hypothetical protein